MDVSPYRAGMRYAVVSGSRISLHPCRLNSVKAASRNRFQNSAQLSFAIYRWPPDVIPVLSSAVNQCLAPATSTATQVHRRRESVRCNTPVERRSAQSGYPEYIANPKERWRRECPVPVPLRCAREVAANPLLRRLACHCLSSGMRRLRGRCARLFVPGRPSSG